MGVLNISASIDPLFPQLKAVWEEIEGEAVDSTLRYQILIMMNVFRLLGQTISSPN